MHDYKRIIKPAIKVEPALLSGKCNVNRLIASKLSYIGYLWVNLWVFMSNNTDM
jgi:hypothetical protein